MNPDDFHPPEAWVPVCELAVKALEAIGCEVQQVKAKFGELRIYWRLPDTRAADQHSLAVAIEVWATEAVKR